jgi:hypothetical protein
MHYVKSDRPVEMSYGSTDANLPQVIIELKTSAALFPEARPPRQIKVEKSNVRHWFLLQELFNRGAIAFAGDHPNVGEP